MVSLKIYRVSYLRSSWILRNMWKTQRSKSHILISCTSMCPKCMIQTISKFTYYHRYEDEPHCMKFHILVDLDKYAKNRKNNLISLSNIMYFFGPPIHDPNHPPMFETHHCLPEKVFEALETTILYEKLNIDPFLLVLLPAPYHLLMWTRCFQTNMVIGKDSPTLCIALWRILATPSVVHKI